MSPFFLRRLILVVAFTLAACSGKNPAESLAAAKAHLAKKEVPAAIIELKNTLQAQPDSTEARLLLGQVLLDSEDAFGAAVEFGKAVDLKAPPDQAVPALARALLRLGQPRKVIELDQTNTLAAPEAVADLKTSVAISHALQGNETKAEAALTDALRAKPDHVPAQLLRARRLAGSGDLAGATALVDGVIAHAPAAADALKLKGDLLLAAGGTPEEAAAEWRKALAADPRDVAAHSALIRQALARNDIAAATAQWEALKKTQPRHFQTRYFEARLTAQKGDLKTAGEQAQQLLKAAPENRELLQLAGVIALQRGELLPAGQHLGKLQQLVPDVPGPRLLLARVYLRAGEPAKALAVLRPVLDSAAPPADAWTLAGSASLLAGDTKQAESYLTRASKQKPDDPRNRTALAVTHIARGEAEAGLGELEAIADTDTGTSADMALIISQINRRNWEAALKAIERLAAKQPGKPAPLHLRGQVLARRGDQAGARAAFEQALAAQPTFFPSVDALANLDLRDKKPEAARARFDALLKADPKNARAMLALAALDERAGKPREEIGAQIKKAVATNPQDLLARQRLVQFQLTKEDTKAALNAAQDAAAAMPDSADALALLAGTQAAAGELNQAVASYNKLITLRPKALQPLLALAHTQLAAKSIPAADDAVAKALALAPNALPAIQMAINVDLIARRNTQALKRARELQAKAPKSSLGWVLEGDVGMATKDWPLASAAFRTALQKQPAPAVAQRLHVALRNTGDKAKADAFAAEWTKAHADDAMFWFHLAGLSIADKHYDRAEVQFGQVLRVAPDHAAALNNLAWVLATQNKSGAVERARRANELAPNQPAYMDTLAMALASAGKPADAVDLQKKALALAPEAHGLRLSLARYLLQAGDKPGARKELDVLAGLREKFAQQAEVKDLQDKL